MAALLRFELEEQLKRLFGAFSRKISDEIVESWFRELRKYEADHVKSAVDTLIREKKSLPVLSEVLALMPKIAGGGQIEICRVKGCVDGAVSLEDPDGYTYAYRCPVCNRWGWKKIKMADPKRLKYKPKEELEAEIRWYSSRGYVVKIVGKM